MKKISAIFLAGMAMLAAAHWAGAASSGIGQYVQQISGAVTATLAAETTKVIGTINIAAGQTIATITNVTTVATVSAVTAITNALPAGSNLLGKVGIDQTTPGTTNLVAAGQNGTWTVQPGNTANTTPWLWISPAVSAPTITKVGATTSSAQLLAASATRKGLEVDCDCANTDAVAINFGAGSAVYASHKQMTPCSNYSPPPGVLVTSAIQIISNSGTQNCRAIEYP